MILYALACTDGHRFDSWFRDADSYEVQLAAGHLLCPTCQSPRVAKTVMAPAVLAARRPAAPARQAPPDRDVTGDQVVTTHGVARSDHVAIPEAGATAVALLDEKGRELRAAIKALRDKIMSQSQDVGDRFVDEARRMHDGDVPERQIYGEASPAEAAALIEDGIMVMPIPRLPEEQN